MEETKPEKLPEHIKQLTEGFLEDSLTDYQRQILVIWLDERVENRQLFLKEGDRIRKKREQMKTEKDKTIF